MIKPKYELPPKQTKSDELRARRIVNARDKGVCVRCHRVNPIFGVNFDHRKNRSQGGRWSPANGQLMCGSGTVGCHGWVTENPEDAIAEGWAMPSYADPTEWPARRYVEVRYGVVRVAWVLYADDDEGSFRVIPEAEAFRRMYGEA